MKVLLGGTFSILHKAHKKMILKGAEKGSLYIGVTSDKYNFNKRYEVPPYEIRVKQLTSFLSENKIEAKISPMDDPYGKTLDPYFDAIVVSNETIGFVNEINFKRRSLGIKPLNILNVGTILAEDLMPIKSERIIKGMIDENGNRIKEMLIGVASKNPEKIKGIRVFLDRIFKKYEMREFDVEGITDQPLGSEIFISARKRVSSLPNDLDYAIGVEAGVMKIGETYYDFHYTEIRDYMGNRLQGISSGLPLNNSIIYKIKSGMNLEEITNNAFHLERSGEKKGAIYYLSDGIKERWELVYESMLSAFSGRIAERISFND